MFYTKILRQLYKIVFMLVGMTPVRISFAGGGTDMPEYFNNYGGNVITTSISKFTYAIIQPRLDNSLQAYSPDFQKHYKPTKFHKLEIEHGTEITTSVIKYLKFKDGINVIICSDVAAGSGLGASSSLTVNLVNTIIHLQGKKWPQKKIADTAFNIGRKILKWPIGKQDEYISAFGGFNFITFNKEKIRVLPIKMNKPSLSEIQKNLLLFFVGDTRNSSKILSNQIQRINQKNKNTINSLNYVKTLAQDMYDSLKKSDLTKFGELLDEGWQAKKKFAKGVTNKKIDNIYDLALKCGAIGGKLTGAGGGGHMLFYCETPKQRKLIQTMKKLGLKQIDFSFYYNEPKILNLYESVYSMTR